MRIERFTTKHRARRYDVRKPRFRISLRAIVLLVLSVTCVASFWMLADYAIDYFRAKKAANDLREIYYAATDTPAPTVHVTATPQPVTALPVATPVPAITPIPVNQNKLPAVYYPGNASAHVSSRFSALQRQNKDIIGWLRIDEMLDEPVVQRDNSYYLRRDYRGYHNTNGAIFLDEGCSLKTRPYALVLYGHNMKTGAMFGSLRNFENLTYYKNNPLISFDTAYEDGRYVIFSISTVSTKTSDRHFFSFAMLNSASISLRKDAIDKLKQLSVFACPVDVRPDDQLLLLVTCVDDPDDRRIIAARRLRPGEIELRVKEQVSGSYKNGPGFY